MTIHSDCTRGGNDYTGYETVGREDPASIAELTFESSESVLASMAHSFFSLTKARRASKDRSIHQLWIDARQCKFFREPGWEELQPHLDGAALFVRRTTRAPIPEKR
jgi:hypothetical protein